MANLRRSEHHTNADRAFARPHEDLPVNDHAQLENETLAQLFESHGVEVRRDGDWLRLPKGLKTRAVVWDHDTEHTGVFMVQLDVVLELWTGRAIVESCAGFGESRKDALQSAFESFAQSALHPMLVAFLHTDDEVVRDAWEIDGSFRAVTIGQVAVRGKPPGGTELDLDWFRTFEAKLKASKIPEGTHWVRLYYAQQDSEPLAKEILLDNEPWTWIQEALAGVTWPQGPNFLSLRVFVVIQGGLDVSRAVARMIEMPGQTDAEIAPVLAEDGADPQQVQALLAYVPLAFGRAALQELPVKFSDTAIVHEQEGQSGVEIQLTDDPVFFNAQRLAYRALERETLSQDQFLVVAMRSAEVHAVNEALTGGADAKDLVVSPPVITLY